MDLQVNSLQHEELKGEFEQHFASKEYIVATTQGTGSRALHRRVMKDWTNS